MYTEFMSRMRVKVLLFFLIFTVVLTVGSSLYLHTLTEGSGRGVMSLVPQESLEQQDRRQVLAVQSGVVPSATPTSTPVPATVKHIPSKQTYRIAVFGDSFVDTMGETMEHLQEAFNEQYPGITFELYNYGIGAQNVEMGLGRFDKSFAYQTRQYAPISQVKADIIIVGSFAYNPFSPHSPKAHRAMLLKLVKRAQATGAPVYMLAEMAPLREDFGNGPKGVDFSKQEAYDHSADIIEQLENTLDLAKDIRVPLIDVYTHTVSSSGGDKVGKRELVNADDGIHPSPKGHELMAEKIVDVVMLP